MPDCKVCINCRPIDNYSLKQLKYISLFVILLIQTGGLLNVLQLKQYFIKCDSKAKMATATHMSTLHLSLQEYENARVDPNEIRYKGKLYDIKDVVAIGNTVVLYVINDLAEDDVVEEIDKTMKRSFPHDKKTAPLIDLLSLEYLMPDIYECFFNGSAYHEQFYVYDGGFCDVSKDIKSPPPKVMA